MEMIQFRGSGYVFATTGTLETTACGKCGIPFAVPEEMLAWARNHPDVSFWCPSGHERHFPGRTMEKKLQDAREELAREKSRHDQTAAHLQGERIAKARFRNERDRLKARAAAGVCPCCNRTFKQLAAHMKTKHPGFTAESSPRRPADLEREAMQSTEGQEF